VRWTILAAATLLAAPCAASAVEPGAEIALQSGFMVPFGRVADTPGAAFSDLFGGFVPFAAEIGWRYTPNLFIGLSGSYSLGLTKDCGTGVTCSGHDTAVAIEIRFHPAPDEGIDPWFSAGVGYEWLFVSQTSNGIASESRFDGLEFVHGQAGANLIQWRYARAGPFVRFSLGKYRSVDNAPLHEFLSFGLRVSLLL